VQTGLVSNADSRISAYCGSRSSIYYLADMHHCSTGMVLEDLDAIQYLNPVVLSEEAGIEKPSPGIFHLACSDGKTVQDCLHVGDELEW